MASPDGSSRAGANPWPEGVVTMATFTRFGEECEAKHAWVWACALCGPRGKALLSPSIDSACLIMLLLLLLPPTVTTALLMPCDRWIFCSLPGALCLLCLFPREYNAWLPA